MAEKLKPGRPPETPGQRKRVPLNMRTTPQTRERLELSANESGRSLVQEVEFRLEWSFLTEDARRDREETAYGGAQQRALFRAFAAVASIIEERTGNSWIKDEWTAVAVNRAWRELIQEFRPMRGSVKQLEAITADLPAKPQAPDIERPRNPHTGLRRPPQEKIDDFNRRADEYSQAMDIYEAELAEYVRKCEGIAEQSLQFMQETAKRTMEFADLGREAAGDFFLSAEQARK